MFLIGKEEHEKKHLLLLYSKNGQVLQNLWMINYIYLHIFKQCASGRRLRHTWTSTQTVCFDLLDTNATNDKKLRKHRVQQQQTHTKTKFVECIYTFFHTYD